MIAVLDRMCTEPFDKQGMVSAWRSWSRAVGGSLQVGLFRETLPNRCQYWPKDKS